MMRRKARPGKGEEGAAAVEFAIVAPLLLLLVFGLIEFGLWLSQYEVMASAAREGARVAAVRGSCTTGGAGDCDVTSDIYVAVTRAASPYTITGPVNEDVQCSDANIGQPVTVSWTQNFTSLNLLTFLPFLPSSRQMTGTFRCE
jgi:Flp pilus assembly protein TadG